MSDLHYLFEPPLAPAVAIRGRRECFPLNRIFCVGRNYEAHAREMGAVADREAPFFFMKASAHYVPSGGVIPMAPETNDLQHEMELVVALGGSGFRVTESAALELVYGYACGLDMTRRDLQQAARKEGRPWDFAKNFENAAVISEIAPASEIGHPGKGLIELAVNGEIRQSSDIAQMIHKVPAVVSYLSRFYHLVPGDVIFTGTPEGVGAVVPGDRLEGRIAGVGGISVEIAAS